MDKYYNRLIQIYSDVNDQDSLLALADVAEQANRARELRIYREQPKTQELIDKAMEAYQDCINKLIHPVTGKDLTDLERVYLFAKMDWCRFTLDIVGEDPNKINEGVENTLLTYAKKVGLAK